ncbi:MAG: peptidoglycan DD-metalloendopeptidase family protein [Blastocatellia bacterium]
MKDDKRFYTFIFAPNATARFRKINLHYNIIYSILGLAFIGLIAVTWAVWRAADYAILAAKYNLTQAENQQLREENSVAKHETNRYYGKLSMLESLSRKLAEASGVSHNNTVSQNIGTGGPGTTSLKNLDQAASNLEQELNQIKEILDSRQLKLASTPGIWPVRGYLSDGFGGRSDPFGGGYENHPGIDISTTHGTAIQATADGVVVYAASMGGYGNLVTIDHGFGVTTRYGHMSRIDVTVGERIHRGKQIGAVGSTGRSTGPHCHYEVRMHDRPVNPMGYLPLGQEN